MYFRSSLCAVVLLFTLLQYSKANCSSRPTLRKYSGYSSHGQGHLRDAVKSLQSLLNKKGGYDLDVDGYFGPLTERAVRSYQTKKGLLVDGIVGPQTWGSLCGSSSSSSLRNPYGERSKGSRVSWNPICRFVVEKLKARFPGKFSCSTYIGSSKSDHPGNAADCFPGRAGVRATGRDRSDGDAAEKWLRKNAASLKVCYVIWQNYIWHRKFGRSFQHKSGVTTGHYDHIHISVNSPLNSC